MIQIKALIAIALLFLTASCQAAPPEQTQQSVRWSEDELFFYGMVAGGFVSLIGFMASFLLLCCRKFIPQLIYTVIIQILFAFSCGALLGQTMLHILPQAYASRHLKDQQVSLTFIAAILSFIVLERIMHRVGISDHHWHGEEDNHGVAEKRELEGIKFSKMREQNHNVTEKRELEKERGRELQQNAAAKQSTGYLNLISSLLHNLIDGLAVGIAFNLGNPNEFLPVTFGIIAHEIPREMGDVAVLLKSRFSPTQTILSNGLVNLISLVGVWMGLNSHGLSPTIKQYCLVFVAGNFMYIASDIWKRLFHHKANLVNGLELAGLLYGVYMTLGHTH